MRSGFRDETSACKCVNGYKTHPAGAQLTDGVAQRKGNFFFYMYKGKEEEDMGEKGEREARITSAHAGQTRGIGRAKGRDCLSVVSGIYRIVDRFLLFLSLSLFTVVVVALVFFSREKKKNLKKVVAILCLFFHLFWVL